MIQRHGEVKNNKYGLFLFQFSIERPIKCDHN